MCVCVCVHTWTRVKGVMASLFSWFFFSSHFLSFLCAGLFLSGAFPRRLGWGEISSQTLVQVWRVRLPKLPKAGRTTVSGLDLPLTLPLELLNIYTLLITVSSLSIGDTFRDPQQMPENLDGTEACSHPPLSAISFSLFILGFHFPPLRRDYCIPIHT